MQCSLELFTPRSAAGVQELLAPRGRLEKYCHIGPSFVSIAGTADGALAIAEHCRKAHCIRPQLHLARSELTEEAAISLVDRALRAGCNDVLVLGGAPGTMQRDSSGGGFGSATELVAFLKRRYGERVRVSVCGFPDGSRGEAGSYAADLEQLGRQVAAGCELVVCMPTFEAAEHAKFVVDARNAGVSCPVLPGLLPLCEAAEFGRICRALHVTPPPAIEQQLTAARGDEAAVRRLCEATLARLVAELAQQGACAPHVYTLNSEGALGALAAAGLRPLKHRSA